MNGHENTIRLHTGRRKGSAMLLTVVLTVLLALVGVFFVMAARVDEAASSSVTTSHDLDGAVDSVTAQISRVLIEDLFGPEEVTSKLHPSICGWYMFADANSFPDRPDYSNFDIINEPWDSPDINPAGGERSDLWLASLEPYPLDQLDPVNSVWQWKFITDLFGNLGTYNKNVTANIIDERAPIWNDTNGDGNVQAGELNWSADADGDGVIDSRWVEIPDYTTAKGESVYAAVRIIDNCSMLNLNTAYDTAPANPGLYLSSINFKSFMRGNEDPNDIIVPRDPGGLSSSAAQYHDDVVMNIENPGTDYRLYDISDELEIRNRYMLTSRTVAKFETETQGVYETMDFGRGEFVPGWGTQLRVKRTVYDTSSFDNWKERLDHGLFYYGFAAPDGKYDRRHVCTFYSFDRNVRRGRFHSPGRTNLNTQLEMNLNLVNADYRFINSTPSLKYFYSNTEDARGYILYLLYAMRSYYMDINAGSPSFDIHDAAVKAAQFVANLIDYVDDNNPVTEGPLYDYGQQNPDPTYINKSVIDDLLLEAGLSGSGDMDFGLDPNTVYGYERQPFITEVYHSRVEPIPGNVIEQYAIEFYNPYDSPVDITDWQLKIAPQGGSRYSYKISSADYGGSAVLLNGGERFVIRSNTSVPVSVGSIVPSPAPVGTAPAFTIQSNEIVELMRPDPSDPGGSSYISADKFSVLGSINNTGVMNYYRSLERDVKNWAFAVDTFVSRDVTFAHIMGDENAVTIPSAQGYAMPVADDNIPPGTLSDLGMILTVGSTEQKAITEYITAAGDESDVRVDIKTNPEILDYICMMNRPEGSLPGRININTATKEIIAAAIPELDSMTVAPGMLGKNIVNERSGDPYQNITELLDVSGFDQFEDPNNVTIAARDKLLGMVANRLTVRSDVFTAYILVRIGYDGPQKRMIAIFDRSNVNSPRDADGNRVRPEIVALHPVPEVR